MMCSVSSNTVRKFKSAASAALIALALASGHASASDNDNASPDLAAEQATNQLLEPADSRPSKEKIDKLFNKGYELFKEEKYQRAAPLLYEYTQLAEPDSGKYEWAEFFLGISLSELGLSHASVDVMGKLARKKPNTKIVSYIIDMFEKITRSQPFDYDEIITKTINGGEFTFLDKNLQDFIFYYQGKIDWEHGLLDWGKESFAKISPESPYKQMARYQEALLEIHNRRAKAAIPMLHDIISSRSSSQSLKDKAHWTLARLLYEFGEYEQAKAEYAKIETPLLEQASFLLEQAWIEYREQNYERSMGYLYAFNAPSFKRFFTPEYFILKSLIYKKLCYYGNAATVVMEFDDRYGQSIRSIYNRSEASDPESIQLLYVILSSEDNRDTLDFLKLLESEKKKISALDLPERHPSFADYLYSIYDLQIAGTASDFRTNIEEEYEKVANELLMYEEESNLIKYEIGVDQYQRIKERRYNGSQEKSGSKAEGMVVYSFQNEYWNDELGNYRVTLPSKCESNETWEVFFE